MKKLVLTACFLFFFAIASRISAQNSAQNNTGEVELFSTFASSATLTLPDGKSCTTAPYHSGNNITCIIPQVAMGKYRVSITRGGQTVQVNLVVRPRGFFESEGSCFVKPDGSGNCDTD